jgi:hypothetical protein
MVYNHKEYQKQYQKAYRAKHREKIVERERKRRSENRERYNFYSIAWRQKSPENLEKARELCRKNVARVRVLRKQRLDELRQTGCSQCGIKEGIRLSFHHVEGNKSKEFNLSSAQTLSEERIDKELEKCVILCNSCHLKLHNPRQFRIYTRKRA